MAIQWSAAELAEMAKIDAEIEAAPITPTEWAETVERDTVAKRRTDKLAEYQRAYREANKDKVAEYRHQYYLHTGR